MVRACIGSLDTHLSDKLFDVKIFVVENDSGDGSLDILTHAFKGRPDIEIISSERNGGYGAGNNLVLSKVVASDEYEFVWLLNSDTLLLTDIPAQRHGSLDTARYRRRRSSTRGPRYDATSFRISLSQFY